VTAGERLYHELGDPGNAAWTRLPQRLRDYYSDVAERVRSHGAEPVGDPRLPGYEVVESDRARTTYERRTA
jgi:hypothetical protein